MESTETTMIFTTGRHEYSITKRALKGYIFTELSTNSGTQSSRIFDTPEALINFIIVQVAEKIGYSSGKITSMFSDDMSNFRKYENELRIRICDEINCKNVFDEGFLTEDSNVFCSEKCCYSSIENLKDDDFGDTILYTNWYEETLISR